MVSCVRCQGYPTVRHRRAALHGEPIQLPHQVAAAAAATAAVVGPPSTPLTPSLDNSYRCLHRGFGLLWLYEHAKSMQDVQGAERRELARAVGDG